MRHLKRDQPTPAVLRLYRRPPLLALHLLCFPPYLVMVAVEQADGRARRQERHLHQYRRRRSLQDRLSAAGSMILLATLPLSQTPLHFQRHRRHQQSSLELWIGTSKPKTFTMSPLVYLKFHRIRCLHPNRHRRGLSAVATMTAPASPLQTGPYLRRRR